VIEMVRTGRIAMARGVNTPDKAAHRTAQTAAAAESDTGSGSV
jgi:hypothetical protein